MPTLSKSEIEAREVQPPQEASTLRECSKRKGDSQDGSPSSRFQRPNLNETTPGCHPQPTLLREILLLSSRWKFSWCAMKPNIHKLNHGHRDQTQRCNNDRPIS